MTFTKIAIIYKAPHLSFEQFKAHYEISNVPLVKSLQDERYAPLLYKRRYIKLNTESKSPGFDAITELVFKDESTYRKWEAHLAEGDRDKRIFEDSLTFTNGEKSGYLAIDEVIE
ncbi:hypothetical protein COCCADRAFT_113144 [Bipolaris zeicola 26-R-13]|uniref:EthD domain-containing protein n=1 Tax=Cochliobolus carbonum (strain 26-R-13) TaxID=930089 RepID=W6Y6F7_COCC2|nr:uncharacterized protein COCCADRAFT_113144 [Bipolaris zeicola 26-R-13]EUC26871.1 hypothetical protein COCCADRAFT_113144 [Bipolaris zeicola 26-R-13]